MAAWAAPMLTCMAALAQGYTEGIRPSEAVRSALEAPGLTESERRQLRVRHGQWSDTDLDTPERRADAALRVWDLASPALADPAAPVWLRAEALLRRGRAEEALSLLAGCEEPACALARAGCLELLGRSEQALAQLAPLESAAAASDATPQALRLGARAVMLRSRLQRVEPSRWKDAADWLGRAREADRLEPTVARLEGQLLLGRHNRPQGVPALREALQRDPRDSEAWYLLGRAALDAFDFESAARAVEALRTLHPAHALADLLEAESMLLQEDPDRAERALEGLLQREPEMPQALALHAAVAARRWDRAETARRLALLDARFPGQATGAATVGRLLSLQRQYGWAEQLLRQAIERRPAWSEPRSELAQMLTQTGRVDDARAALAEAARLDPFDKSSAFAQWLLDTMGAWRVIETPHFRIRVKPGVDEAVAASMAEPLEAMHRQVADRFGHEPAERTTIELLPDHEFFGVRITGMPSIHTMAASTGPVIAMEAPRGGNPRKHLGTYDWLEVLRHEYTHTVTLSQTGNRIPHWLTEALAVSMETKPRSMETCRLLADALATGRLFPLDRIKWAFVRPETPQDRPLGYAQGRWMVEFLEATWGRDAVPKLLERYRQGDDEDAALRATIGMGAGEFFERFLPWAKQQVRAWGLDPQPSMDALVDQALESDASLRETAGEARMDRLEAVAKVVAARAGRPARAGEPPLAAARWPAPKLPAVEVTDARLDAWLSQHPDHPDLLEIKLRRRMEAQPELNETTRALLDAYARARPVDPLPDRLLARVGGPGAVAHLRRLDALEERNPAYALELARLLRAQGDLPAALACVEKAARIDGYDPATRELAAAIALEAGRPGDALRHVQALQLLEPEQPRHAERRRKLEAMLAPASARPSVR